MVCELSSDQGLKTIEAHRRCFKTIIGDKLRCHKTTLQKRAKITSNFACYFSHTAMTTTCLGTCYLLGRTKEIIIKSLSLLKEKQRKFCSLFSLDFARFRKGFPVENFSYPPDEIADLKPSKFLNKIEHISNKARQFTKASR